MKFQDKSQLGLHFDPDKLREAGYRVTSSFWNMYRDKFQYKSEDGDVFQDTAVQLVIEASVHTLQELEHNTGGSIRQQDELETASLVLEQVVTLVTKRF